MQCKRGLSLRLWFTKAVTRPAFARPSHMPTYSGLLSNKRATVSPGLNPASSKTWATLLLNSSTCKERCHIASPYALSKHNTLSYLLEGPFSSFENKCNFVRMLPNIAFKNCRHNPVFPLKVANSEKYLKVARQTSAIKSVQVLFSNYSLYYGT